jgi:hypothetical protein
LEIFGVIFEADKIDEPQYLQHSIIFAIFEEEFYQFFGNLCWLSLKINQDSDAYSCDYGNIFELSLAAIEMVCSTVTECFIEFCFIKF